MLKLSCTNFDVDEENFLYVFYNKFKALQFCELNFYSDKIEDKIVL